MTIGTITANSATTIGITATGFVGVTTGGPLTVASGVSAGGAIQLTASEGAAPDTNNVTVNAGITVTSTAGNITIQAGDNLTILGGVFANLATGVINLLSLDSIDVPSTGVAGMTGTVFTIHGSLQANQINITGSAQDDNFDIKLSGIHSTNSPRSMAAVAMKRGRPSFAAATASRSTRTSGPIRAGGRGSRWN